MEQDGRGAQVKEMRTAPSEGDAHGGGLGRVAACGGAKTERECIVIINNFTRRPPLYEL